MWRRGGLVGQPAAPRAAAAPGPRLLLQAPRCLVHCKRDSQHAVGHSAPVQPRCQGTEPLPVVATGKRPFSRLIYPLPEANTAGLGTHLTLDVAGGVKFGPDSEWIAWDPDEGPDYTVDPARSESPSRCPVLKLP